MLLNTFSWSRISFNVGKGLIFPWQLPLLELFFIDVEYQLKRYWWLVFLNMRMIRCFYVIHYFYKYLLRLLLYFVRSGIKHSLKTLNIFIFFRNKSGYFPNTFGKALTWNKQIDPHKNKFIEERRRKMKRRETTSTILS